MGLTSIEDIIKLDETLWVATKGLPIRLGSITKLPAEAYSNWDIELTPENRQALMKEEAKFRNKDLEEQAEWEKVVPNYEELRKTSTRAALENRMAVVIGEVVKELLRVLDDGERHFRICDIPSRMGQAASAIAMALRLDAETSGIVDRTTFHLVDVSASKLALGADILKPYKASSIIHPLRDEEFLTDAEDEKFDIVVSIGHFHHKSFPGPLRDIYRILADSGALVSADWHSALLHHPLRVHGLLEKFGVEDSRLELFRNTLGDCLRSPTNPGFTPEELKAMQEHTDDWLEMLANLRARRAPRNMRTYLLDGHDTTRGRLKKLSDAGFQVNMDDIRAAFPRARLDDFPKRMTSSGSIESDFATVVVAAKSKQEALPRCKPGTR